MLHGGDDVVGAAGEYQHGGGGADEEGVDVDGEGLDEALLDGVGDLGGGGHDGAGALAGLVAVDAALDAPGDGAAEQGATHLVDPHGAAQHLHEYLGHELPVEEEHDDGEEDVDQRHDGGHHLGHVGYALDAADDDQRNEQCHSDADQPDGEVEGAGEGEGDAVAVDGR